MIRPRPFKARAMLIVVGRNVRAQRRERGLTQRELSEQARIKKKHLGAGERRRKLHPRDARMAEVLECDLVDLVKSERGPP